ncbi:MAG: LacI family DNA-binding transcriptional regulator [Bacillota bacterium]
MALTISDIAELSKVSTATVSRVINSPEKVSESTRKKVMKVIEKYNYQPSGLAKSFRTKKSKTLALFIYDIDNPFYARLIKELNKMAFDKDYTLIICDTENNRDRELEYINYINQNKIEGLIMTEGISTDHFNKLDNNMYLVCIDRDIDCEIPCLRVTTNNRESVAKAVEYLVNLNHRKIGLVTGPKDVKTSIERKNGYLDIVKKYNLPVDDTYIYEGDFKRESGSKALDYFLSLSDVPSAIFCSNDLMAEGLLSRAISLNIDIPNDLSIIGFDGVSKSLYKSLTTIKQDIEGIAETSIDGLVAMIEGGEKENTIKEISGEFLIGETCKRLKSGEE